MRTATHSLACWLRTQPIPDTDMTTETVSVSWNRNDKAKAEKLHRLHLQRQMMPSGGVEITLARVKSGATRAQWIASDGMQVLATWPNMRRALWTMHAAGFRVARSKRDGGRIFFYR